MAIAPGPIVVLASFGFETVRFSGLGFTPYEDI